MSEVEKYSKLNDIEKKIRISIMDIIIEKKRSVCVDEAIEILDKVLDFDVDYIKETINNFQRDNILVVEDGNINFIYPVSAIPNSHKVTLDDGREFHAMCAIDAIGTSCTFNQNVTIESSCCVTGKEVRLRVEDEAIKNLNNKDIRILHVDLDKHAEWAANC